jgi:hypothetical protein
MSAKRIIILGSGFCRVKWAEALGEELPLDQAVVQFSRENPSRRQPATGGSRRLLELRRG